MEATEQVAEDSGTTVTTDSGTTDASLTSESGTSQTTVEGSELGTPSDEFYDPSTLPSELLPLQKQLQAAYTKKTQGLSDLQKSLQAKADAYDTFQADPEGTVRQLAQQLGIIGNQQQQNQNLNDWSPENWTEVMDRLKEEARTDLMKEMEPVLSKVRDIQKSQIETQLDTSHPDWRSYEQDMINLLSDHPTLANDPDRLYDMALPPEVRKRRAMQEAMRKIQQDSDGASVTAPSKTTKQPTSLPAVTDFQTAVQHAKAKLGQS